MTPVDARSMITFGLYLVFVFTVVIIGVVLTITLGVELWYPISKSVGWSIILSVLTASVYASATVVGAIILMMKLDDWEDKRSEQERLERTSRRSE